MISAETENVFLTNDELRSRAAQGGPFATLFDWVQSYPMNTHADLGRAGVVCPFTRQARRFDTMRLGLCGAGPEEEERAFTIIRRGFEELARIPANRGMEQFRTVVIAFPGCDSEAGIAMLQRAQRRHRFYAMLRFRMMGFMHPHSESPGLWNPDFRPLRPCRCWRSATSSSRTWRSFTTSTCNGDRICCATGWRARNAS